MNIDKESNEATVGTSFVAKIPRMRFKVILQYQIFISNENNFNASLNSSTCLRWFRKIEALLKDLNKNELDYYQFRLNKS